LNNDNNCRVYSIKLFHLVYLIAGRQHGNIPPMPKAKPIGIMTASWRIPNGVHVEFWYDFTGGGKGPWTKICKLR